MHRHFLIASWQQIPRGVTGRLRPTSVPILTRNTIISPGYLRRLKSRGAQVDVGCSTVTAWPLPPSSWESLFYGNVKDCVLVYEEKAEDGDQAPFVLYQLPLFCWLSIDSQNQSRQF